jgi:sugar lactone lactonase YvrE
VYVADTYNSTIRKVTGGVVTTIAGVAGAFGSIDGSGTAARFYYPSGVAIDSSGNLYVTDMYNEEIRKITPAGTVSTLAGQTQSGSVDGTGSAARFKNAAGIAVDAGGTVYVADTDNATIRRITAGGTVSTFAGKGGEIGVADGTGTVARFNNPSSIFIDSLGNALIADTGNHTIRRMTPGGSVTTLAGTPGTFGNADGVGSGAQFNFPNAAVADSAGNIYVADSVNHTIRKITSSGVVSTLAGLALQAGVVDGTGSAARFNFPIGVAVDSAGNLYVSDYGNFTIRKITPAGVVTTLAGLAGQRAYADGTGSSARFSAIGLIATDAAGNIYVPDTDSRTIRKVTPAGVVTTLAGLAGQSGSTDGTGSAARFSGPEAVATDSSGNVYVADTGNNAIRRITPAGVVTTVAGSPSQSGEIDGTGSAASFYQPWGVAVDAGGNIWIAARFTDSIRMGKAALADVASIDSTTGPIGVTRHLFGSPNTATSWQWSVIRRPPDSTATISSDSSASPTFTPDKSGVYLFRLVATRDGTTSITTTGLQVVPRNRAVR